MPAPTSASPRNRMANRLRSIPPTIFSEMSALAVRTGSLNLGQGFPDRDGPTGAVEAAVEALRAGRNQYPPGPGIPELREAVAEHQAALRPDDLQRNPSEANGVPTLTIVDSNDPLDLVQPPDLTAAVLVAREGISSSALRAAVVEHLGGSAEARVLLVKRGRRARRDARAGSASAENSRVEELSLRQ